MSRGKAYQFSFCAASSIMRRSIASSLDANLMFCEVVRESTRLST